MLSGKCTEALSIQANVTISGSSAKLIKNDIAPLPFPALLKQYWYIKRGERVRVRGHAPFYATLGLPQNPSVILPPSCQYPGTILLLCFHPTLMANLLAIIGMDFVSVPLQLGRQLSQLFGKSAVGCCSNGDEPATQSLHFRLVPLDWLS